PGPSRSSSPRSCRRPARARSCSACCATRPRAGRWATPRRTATPRASRRSASRRPPSRRGTDHTARPGAPAPGTARAATDVPIRAQLLRLYVDPGQGGRGIGRRLHDEGLGHLRAAGFRVAVAWVLERNLRARAISERWGWRPTPAVSTAYPGVREVCYLLTL